MNASFRIEGLEKLQNKLKSLEDVKWLKALMRAAGNTLKQHVNKYPPATAANAPGSAPGDRWYERGQGGHYIRIRDGGESIYKTSETLGRSWTTSVKDAGLTVVVGAHASYAPYVQDAEQQSPWHKKNGWGTVQDVIEQFGPEITEHVRVEVEKKLSA